VNLKRFQEAWQAEFTHKEDSIEYLATWINIMHRGGGQPREFAKCRLLRWLSKALDAPDTRARIRKFLRALDVADNPAPLSTRAIASVTYQGLVANGVTGITKKSFWQHVVKRHEALGLPVPKSRTRILREIGLDDLPEEKPGRPARQKQISSKPGP
jgi:hypothetical protein